MEAELKLRLPSRAAFEALCNSLAKGKRGVHQRNQFFDTSDEQLAGSNYHLRLRTEQCLDPEEAAGERGERWIVTAKGPKRPPTGAAASIAIRPEEEICVAAADAAAFQRGERCPLDALPASELTNAMRERAGGAPIALARVAFDNTRIGALVTLDTSAGSLEVTLELDATTFEWAGESEEQWEVECEMPAEEAESLAGPIEEAVQELLRDMCGHTCPPADGKLRRLKAFRRAAEARAEEAGAAEATTAALKNFRQAVEANAAEVRIAEAGAADAVAAVAKATETRSDGAKSAEARASARSSQGVGGHMLDFGAQAAFEAWLQQCPLPPSSRAEYAVVRTQTGFDVRCGWHLPFAQQQQPQQQPAAANRTSHSQAAAAPLSLRQPPPPATAAPSTATPSTADRGGSGMLASVQALVQAAEVAPASPSVPDDASTLAFVQRTLSRIGSEEGGGAASLSARQAWWANGSSRPDPPVLALPASDGTLLVSGEQPPSEHVATGYLWAQTLSEVGVSLRLPLGTRARSVTVDMRRNRIRCALMSAPAQVLLDVPLLCPIVADAGSWTIESSKAANDSSDVLTLQIVLEKAVRGSFWLCLSDGHRGVQMPARWPLVGV